MYQHDAISHSYTYLADISFASRRPVAISAGACHASNPTADGGRHHRTDTFLEELAESMNSTIFSASKKMHSYAKC
jgi:hypothetical protein